MPEGLQSRNQWNKNSRTKGGAWAKVVGRTKEKNL